MSITYNDTLKTNRMQLMSDLVASKVAATSTGTASAGQLVIGTAALSGGTGILATIPLPATPPFLVTTPVAGTVTATLQGTPLSANASASGTAAKAELRNNTGVTVASGLTVGTSGSDINLTLTNITAGQTVTVTSGIVTHG